MFSQHLLERLKAVAATKIVTVSSDDDQGWVLDTAYREGQRDLAEEILVAIQTPGNVGAELRALRTALQLTEYEAAEVIGSLSVAVIHEMEAGTFQMTDDFMGKVMLSYLRYLADQQRFAVAFVLLSRLATCPDLGPSKKEI